jgi:hypothetical protein
MNGRKPWAGKSMIDQGDYLANSKRSGQPSYARMREFLLDLQFQASLAREMAQNF